MFCPSTRPGHQSKTLVLSSFWHLGRKDLAQARRLLLCNKMPSRLATSLCGIPLKTPVLAASGTYAYGVELRDLVDLSALGGIVVKGLSREPMDGNPPPRVWETEAGMINSIGLQNIGVRAFVSRKAARAARRWHRDLRQRVRLRRRRLSRSRPRARRRRGRRRLRAQRLLSQHQARRNLLFERPGAAGRSGRSGAQDREATADGEAFSQRRAHRAAGEGRRGSPAPTLSRW